MIWRIVLCVVAAFSYEDMVSGMPLDNSVQADIQIDGKNFKRNFSTV